MGQSRHLGVLLGHAFVGVNEDEAHVGPFDGHGGTEHRKLFDPVVHLGFLPHPGGVDKEILAQLVFKKAVHRVPGGARHIADDDPLFPQDAVDQRGLPHVRLADDRHLDDVVLFPLLLLRRKVLDAGVQKVAGAVSVDG